MARPPCHVIFFGLRQLPSCSPVSFEGLAWRAKLLIAGYYPCRHCTPWCVGIGCSESTALLRLGVFSFVIYLLNTPCIGWQKAFCPHPAIWDGHSLRL